ncbi:MAG: SMR family transporter [Akkermansiaceae bacterium]|nr:SMR family transporter [Akkermansiaceae bacterium]
MHWYFLIVSALIDTVYGIAIYHSKGFTQVRPAALAVLSAILTSYFLALAMRAIPAGVSFMVWSGVASLGVALYGIIILQESVSIARLSMMLLIIIGVGGLKLMEPT